MRGKPKKQHNVKSQPAKKIKPKKYKKIKLPQKGQTNPKLPLHLVLLSIIGTCGVYFLIRIRNQAIASTLVDLETFQDSVLTKDQIRQLQSITEDLQRVRNVVFFDV